MIRKGQVGAAAGDGITEEHSETIAAVGRTNPTGPKAQDWVYHSGQLPQ
jgi:hypothetical protein